MTNNIPGIGINTGSVNPYGGKQKNPEAKPETKPEAAPAAPQKAPVKPDDVLSYMAQSAVVVQPKVTAPKVYDVSKYNTPEQVARIAGLMASFEDKVVEGLVAINAELGENNKMSEPLKYEIAAGLVG